MAGLRPGASGIDPLETVARMSHDDSLRNRPNALIEKLISLGTYTYGWLSEAIAFAPFRTRCNLLYELFVGRGTNDISRRTHG
jgi:hypothetical protein